MFIYLWLSLCVCAVVFGRCLQILHVMGTEFGAAFVVRCPFGSCWLNLSSALLCSATATNLYCYCCFVVETTVKLLVLATVAGRCGALS